MSEFLNFLGKSESTMALLTVVSFVSALIMGIIAVLQKDNKSLAVKIFATFLILCMALLANNAFVYALSILMVAILITNLGFLQNIASISGDRSWWSSRKATFEEVEAKRAFEAKTLGENNSSAKSSSDSNDPDSVGNNDVPVPSVSESAFADMVIEALVSTRLFQNHQISREISLDYKGNPKYLIDAVANTTTVDYVLEIRNHISLTNNLSERVREYVSSYEELIRGHRLKKEVKGIIIMQAGSDSADFVDEKVAVLKFDSSNKKFVNLEKIKRWLLN